MIVKKNPEKPKVRKLVAVIGLQNIGFYLRDEKGGSVYIKNGLSVGERFASITQVDESLEEILAANSKRTPVYEGDRITITF